MFCIITQKWMSRDALINSYLQLVISAQCFECVCTSTRKKTEWTNAQTHHHFSTGRRLRWVWPTCVTTLLSILSNAHMPASWSEYKIDWARMTVYRWLFFLICDNYKLSVCVYVEPWGHNYGIASLAALWAINQKKNGKSTIAFCSSLIHRWQSEMKAVIMTTTFWDDSLLL